MRIRLVVKVDGAAAWQREVDRPYPAVPRAEDWVHLGESDEGEGLFATPVAVVTWENDGSVTLRFDMTAGGADAAGMLQSLGFERIESRRAGSA